MTCANLAFLESLDPDDVTWLLGTGREFHVNMDCQVIREGDTPEELYFVLAGLLGVRVPEFGDAVVATLGPGHVLGEISLLDDGPATASVFALENSQLLSCSRTVITDRLSSDAAFAARFYRTLALYSTRRLQERVATFSQWDAESRSRSPHYEFSALRRLQDALAAFTQCATDLDTALLHDGAQSDGSSVSRLGAAFAEVLAALTEIVDSRTLSTAARREAEQMARRDLLPLALLSEKGERFYAKPRGYAGDYLTIHKIYQDEAIGHGRIGPLIDRLLLDAPPVSAVRKRRHFLTAQIERTMRETVGKITHVTTLACGPAAEIFDAFERIPDSSALHVTLIDIDLQALAYVADRRDAAGLRRQMDLVPANLVYLATGRQTLDVPPQDLIYSIGLIDYFNDEFVLHLLNFAFDHIRPGGRAILGNFHPRNPARAFQSVVLDWPLIHRTESDLDAVFKASRFGTPCDEILADDAGIQLFGVVTRASS